MTSRTVPVLMPSRSMASSVKVSVLTSVPGVSLTFTDSSVTSSSEPKLAVLAIIRASAAVSRVAIAPFFRLCMVLLDGWIRLGGKPDAGAHHRQHEQREDRRADNAAQDDAGQRLHELEPGDIMRQSEGQKRTGGDEGRREDRDDAIGGASDHGFRARAALPGTRKPLDMAQDVDAVSHRDAEHGQETRKGNERGSAAEADDHEATDERRRQGQEHECGKAPARQCRLQQQEDQCAGGDDGGHELPFGAAPGRSLALKLEVIFEGELDLSERLLDVASDACLIAVLHVDVDIGVARHSITLNHDIARLDVDLGDIVEADGAAVRRVDGEVADARQALADLRLAPDDHVENLLVLEQAAHLDAGKHGRGCAADVAGLDSVLLCAGEIRLDLDCGSLEERMRADRRDSGDGPGQLSNFGGLVLE